MKAIASCLFFILLIMAAVSNFMVTIVPMIKRRYDITGHIFSLDVFKFNFAYKVNMSLYDLIVLLSQKDPNDDVTCTFDYDESTVRFSTRFSHIDYTFELEERDDYSVLTLRQTNAEGIQPLVAYNVTPFIISRIHAEPISKR